MNNYYPQHLTQRPTHAAFTNTDIACGDIVTLHPVGGQPVESIVKVVVPIFGKTTYTSELCGTRRGAGAPVRFRFRLQDVHHVVPAAGRC